MAVRINRSMYPFGQLRDEMDRLVNGLFNSPAAARGMVAGRAYPAINIWESGDQLFAEAEVPGLTSENFEITVVGNELTLKGDRPDASVEGQTYHRRERGVGTFTRVVRLPVEIDAERVEAALKDGVLLITLPKAEAAKPRKIQVNATLNQQ